MEEWFLKNLKMNRSVTLLTRRFAQCGISRNVHSKCFSPSILCSIIYLWKNWVMSDFHGPTSSGVYVPPLRNERLIQIPGQFWHFFRVNLYKEVSSRLESSGNSNVGGGNSPTGPISLPALENCRRVRRWNEWGSSVSVLRSSSVSFRFIRFLLPINYE